MVAKLHWSGGLNAIVTFISYFQGFQMSGIPWVFWPEPLELGGKN